jgi:hypothetical protein
LKFERNSVIAGQKIKTVRDMLRHLAPQFSLGEFTLEDVVEYLHEQLWSDHVRGAKQIPDQTAAAQA